MKATATQDGWKKVQRKVDYMDVNQEQVCALTEDERKELLQKKLCFYCRKPGHINQNCRKHLGQGKTRYTERESRSLIKKTDVTEEPTQLARTEIDEIVARIRSMNDDMKSTLNDQLAVDELGF